MPVDTARTRDESAAAPAEAEWENPKRTEVLPSSSQTLVQPVPPLFDEARLAVAGFLARYSGATRTSYTTDLRQFFTWCAQHDLDVFAVRRGHVEL